jgi:DNA-binding transcriptional ArsR family regulator
VSPSLVFSALGDPTRCALVETLARGGDASVTTLSSGFAISRQAVSKHLTALADAGVVSAHRVGREQRYRLEPTVIDSAAAWMREVGSQWDDRLAALQRHLSRS